VLFILQEPKGARDSVRASERKQRGELGEEPAANRQVRPWAGGSRRPSLLQPEFRRRTDRLPVEDAVCDLAEEGVEGGVGGEADKGLEGGAGVPAAQRSAVPEEGGADKI